jgi:hypothetical protein
VDVHDFGMILPNCSIQEIQNSIRRISSLPAKQLEQMARRAWGYARANHTKERFAQEYRKAIEHILAMRIPDRQEDSNRSCKQPLSEAGENRSGFAAAECT